MKFLLGILVVVVMVPSALGTTTIQPVTANITSIQVVFNQLDSNHDNVIDYSEFMAIFHGADTNHDFKMSIQEYAVYTQISTDFVKAIYNVIDHNKDHFVDKKEFDSIFHKFDANTNGQISETEFVNEYMKIYKKALQHLNLAVGK